jgi:phosphoglycolate phosphatase-like HAD superfamily hydrolase
MRPTRPPPATIATFCHFVRRVHQGSVFGSAGSAIATSLASPLDVDRTRSKGDIVTEYVTRLASDPVRVLMVGDQPSDLAAATQAGTDFITIVAPGDAYDWAKPFPVVSDFAAFVAVADGNYGIGRT